MRSVSEKVAFWRWLERYANTPIELITKEEAIRILKRNNLLDEDGNVKDEWRDIIQKKEN